MIGRNIAPSRRDAIRALAALSVSLPTLANATPAETCPAAVSQRWSALLSAYREAQAAEDAYDQGVIEPFFVGIDKNDQAAWRKAAKPITRAMWDHLECLGDERLAAEKALMECPSPHASAFALKYVIAHGNGREADCWDDLLEAEAKQFGGRA
ncbi:MAG: hypothetical protein CL949_13830 [Erythrobacter sp.]|nr:hypothetical protein [Erythrobacter sp.]|tara:strand:+ start:3388 stop:3849 length:462 start_codon:yes stop_codon:yes gene_type:complete